MPFLDLSTSSESDVNLSLGVELEADWNTIFGISSDILIGLNMVPNMYIDILFEVDSIEFGPDIDTISILRINSEANVFLEATMEFDLDWVNPIIPIIQTFLAVFNLGIDMEAETTFSESETNELLLTVSIFPTLNVSANYQEYKTRFKIDGVEIPISAYSVKAAPNKIGLDVSVTLSRISDKSLVVPTSIYSLEIGVVINESITWFLIASGILTADTFNIGWDKNSPTDSVELSHSSGLANRVNVSPLNTTVIYDPTDVTLTTEDFQPIYDIGGTPYPVILIPVSGLTLYTILSITFGACGLSFSTNIPDFRVKRIDIEIGQSYFQTVGQLFGVFEPIIVERDEVVYILDSSMLSVAGFGSPNTITPLTYKSLVINRNINDINGYIVKYNESKNAWDSYDDNEDTVTNEVVDIDENKSTIMETTTFTRNYKRMSIPGVIVRSEIRKIITDIFIIDPVAYNTTDPVLINETVEQFTYDSTGKILRRIKRESTRVPIWYPSTNPVSAPGDGYWQYDFIDVRYEQDNSVYKANQFKHGTEYRETFSQIARALVYIDPDKIFETKDEVGVLEIDPDKEVPIDYKQEYVAAYRAGNLSEDGETEYSAVMSKFEKVTPLNKDFSRVETKETDFLTKIIIINVAEEQVGEIATSSQLSVKKQFIVYGYGMTRDSRRLETLNIGEIPLVYGVALAQRKIEHNNSKEKHLSMEIIGFDPTIDRASVISVIGRDSENLGNYLLIGYSIEGKMLGTPRQIVMTTAEGLLT